MSITTDFADMARFTIDGAAASVYGLYLVGSDANPGKSAKWNFGDGTNFKAFSGNPKFAFSLNFSTVFQGDGQYVHGVVGGYVSTGSATSRHFGFKAIRESGVVNVYATQADGTTETKSSVLTTLAAGDVLDLIAEMTSDSLVNYYWRKNGGAMSSATVLNTNYPAASSTTDSNYCEFGFNATAYGSPAAYVAGAIYRR